MKHVIKEGSRKHTVWWDSQGKHCSESNCEINQQSKQRKSTNNQ